MAQEQKQDVLPEDQLYNEMLTSESAELHRRTLRFALSVAARLALPQVRLVGGYALGRAYWYSFEGKKATQEDVETLNAKIQELVNEAAPISQTKLPWKKALEYFRDNQQIFAAELVETHVQDEVAVNVCKGEMRLNLMKLHENLGQLAKTKEGFRHEVRLTEDGNLLLVFDNQETYEQQSALLNSFADHVRWGEGKSVRCVAHLNKVSVKGSVNGRTNLVLAAESRQDQKIARICEQIVSRGTVRVLCIAGPTSSGKTTFAHKLSVFLSNYGLPATPLTVDHYYLDLEDQPRYISSGGDRLAVDYDHIESMDVKLVNQHANELLEGKEVLVPKYDFKSGRRVGGTPLSIPKNGILIMEGIHALNPFYVNGMAPELLYKIYISPLTALLVDDFNAVKSTQHRLLRRMTRDFLFRGYSASHTLNKWPTVRRGEHKYIFRYQNQADFVMNSAMEYELPVLKLFTAAILQSVPTDDPSYEKSQELYSLLEPVAPWPDRPVPNTSLLREFIGDGAFDVH